MLIGWSLQTGRTDITLNGLGKILIYQRLTLISCYVICAKKQSPRLQITVLRKWGLQMTLSFPGVWFLRRFWTWTSFYTKKPKNKAYVFVPPSYKRAEKEGCGGNQMMDFFRLFYLWICTLSLRVTMVEPCPPSPQGITGALILCPKLSGTGNHTSLKLFSAVSTAGNLAPIAKVSTLKERVPLEKEVL